ncbi:hypothetical protein [Acrocarpospora sp. B8E8]|uniref:hypothetical protein n=1 Tax=Acrocarpospora sp. B8E8 TaxID=3153572 RepID=UPI00325E9F6E
MANSRRTAASEWATIVGCVVAVAGLVVAIWALQIAQKSYEHDLALQPYPSNSQNVRHSVSPLPDSSGEFKRSIPKDSSTRQDQSMLGELAFPFPATNATPWWVTVSWGIGLVLALALVCGLFSFGRYAKRLSEEGGQLIVFGLLVTALGGVFYLYAFWAAVAWWCLVYLLISLVINWLALVLGLEIGVNRRRRGARSLNTGRPLRIAELQQDPKIVRRLRSSASNADRFPRTPPAHRQQELWNIVFGENYEAS